MAETKPKESSSLRQPKAKKKLGLSVPPALRMPHDDLIQSMPSQTSVTSLTRHTTGEEISDTSAVPVSPVRDYSKVANSIRREAIPAGLFKGKSKQLYDVLYDLTRGAISPQRKVRVPRPKLMKLAHIGARVTFEANVEHLRAVGLIAVTVLTGEHKGNEYEVFIPEELSMPSQTSHTSQSSQTRHAQKLDRLVSLESSQTRHTLTVDLAGGYANPKTSFKTNTEEDDDEAFARLVARLRKAAKEITGREPSAAEAERWDQLGDLLVTELKIAAGRTNVSSVPAFLTEHLRRRLWKKDRRQVEEEGKSAAAESGESIKVDASNCPDCFGTGMWYPEGFDKGVARCGHGKLTSEMPAQN